MRGLKPPERDLLKYIQEYPATGCDGDKVAPRYQWTDEEMAAMGWLFKHNRIKAVPCPSGCGREHLVLTTEGLEAYRLDQALKLRS